MKPRKPPPKSRSFRFVTTQEQGAAVVALSARTGVPISEILRRALDRTLAESSNDRERAAG